MQWNGGDDNPGNRRLWRGVAGWGLFCVLAVALRGIRWDEAYEHALIITRQVPYPLGHPAYRYACNVFSLQSYLSAAWLAVAPSPALLCGLRNGLELAAGVIPVFLLGGLLTGKALGGHIAAVLVLLEVHKPFQSYYPIEVWPHFFSVGPVGTGCALLILALFIAGARRAPWFLLGLLPAVHMGQFPPIAFVAIVLFFMDYLAGRRETCRNAVFWGMAGLLGCAAFWAIKQGFYVPPPDSGAYAAQDDPWPIWSAYSALHDVHRFFPRYGAFAPPLILAFMVLIILGGLIRARFAAVPNSNSGNEWSKTAKTILQSGIRGEFLVGLYGVAALGAVLAVYAIHSMMGPKIPFLLIGWMPYRLLNHLPVLLIAVSLAALSMKRKNDASHAYGDGLILLLLLYAALLPLIRLVLPEILVSRYCISTDSLLFALTGGAAAAVWSERRSITARSCEERRGGTIPDDSDRGKSAIILPKTPRNEKSSSFPSCTWERTCSKSCALWTIGLLAAFLALAYCHQFGTACFVVGAGGVVVSSSIPLNQKRFGTYAMGALLVIITVTLLVREGRSRTSLPVAPIQNDIVRYLEAQGVPNALLVTPYWDVEWLSHTRHPIMADYQTTQLMTYLPNLAPAIKKLHHDIYGIEVDAAQPWTLEAWPKRSREEWRRLGRDYHFGYVVSPKEYPLALEPVLQGSQHTLYRIPPR